MLTIIYISEYRRSSKIILVAKVTGKRKEIRVYGHGSASDIMKERIISLRMKNIFLTAGREKTNFQYVCSYVYFDGKISLTNGQFIFVRFIVDCCFDS